MKKYPSLKKRFSKVEELNGAIKLTARDHWFSRAGRNEFFPHSAIVADSLKWGRNLVKVIIPKELKKEILKNLAEKKITKEYLFPNER